METVTSSSSIVSSPSNLDNKIHSFLASEHFAVVGASRDNQKYGAKVLRSLIDQHKDVVPINPNATVIQGIACLKALLDLPDPTHTSVSIITPPKITLNILQQAKQLGIPFLWLQPGAQDDTVLQYIIQSQLEDRCIYSTRSPPPTSHVLSAALAGPFHVLTGPGCSTDISLPEAIAAAVIPSSSTTFSQSPTALAVDASIPTSSAPSSNDSGSSLSPVHASSTATSDTAQNMKSSLPSSLTSSSISHFLSSSVDFGSHLTTESSAPCLIRTITPSRSSNVLMPSKL